MLGFMWCRRFQCRKLLTIVLILYLLVTLLCLIHIDLTGQGLGSWEDDNSFSKIFPDQVHQGRRRPFSTNGNHSFYRLGRNITKRGYVDQLSAGVLGAGVLGTNINFQLMKPSPLSEPVIDVTPTNEKSGDFIPIGKESYVYSAFLDDRKQARFIRLITLMTQKESKLGIHCYFNDSLDIQVVTAEYYQLCENHNKHYGGFIFSCPVPGNLQAQNLRVVVITLTKLGPRVTLPVINTRPPEHKLQFLNAYPSSSNIPSKNKKKNNNVPSNPKNDKNSKRNENDAESPYSHHNLSFAICVSPLFGNISVHRLVEFVELSRLLGAEHIYFYNYSLTPQISAALGYYVARKLATVLPWAFPPEVGAKVWYHGQLLANNDCLYRSMPKFDLVSFNDLDEFIVPHNNVTNWRDAFSTMLHEDRCGFSFQSAFYDPGLRETFESTLLTPVLNAKSKTLSKVRTKVMLCPWRVFEVGIHHISKQNREDWMPYGIDPQIAYIHHYRRCIANFGMVCSVWEKDTIIEDRYLHNMSINFDRVIQEILYIEDSKGGEPPLVPTV